MGTLSSDKKGNLVLGSGLWEVRFWKAVLGPSSGKRLGEVGPSSGKRLVGSRGKPISLNKCWDPVLGNSSWEASLWKNKLGASSGKCL